MLQRDLHVGLFDASGEQRKHARKQLLEYDAQLEVVELRYAQWVGVDCERAQLPGQLGQQQIDLLRVSATAIDRVAQGGECSVQRMQEPKLARLGGVKLDAALLA